MHTKWVSMLSEEHLGAKEPEFCFSEEGKEVRVPSRAKIGIAEIMIVHDYVQAFPVMSEADYL